MKKAVSKGEKPVRKEGKPLRKTQCKTRGGSKSADEGESSKKASLNVGEKTRKMVRAVATTLVMMVTFCNICFQFYFCIQSRSTISNPRSLSSLPR